MLFQGEIQWVVTLMLVAIRTGVLFFATPLDAFGKVPTQVKLWVSVAFSVLIATTMDLQMIVVPSDVVELVMMAVSEVMAGLIMAFGLYTAFGAFMIAGGILDYQTGFAAANVFNPALNSQNPLLGTVISMFALLFFFLVDGHHMLLRGIIFSYQMMPVGSALPDISMSLIMAQFGMMFTFGVVLAGPVIAVLLMLDGGAAIMARTMPQMNVYFLFLPLKILVGLMLLASVFIYMTPVMNEIFQRTFRFWHSAFVLS
ncbi:hypothetical protein A9Q99_08140 [Gammaproteobacteria bacterium 45_16_T64]|mgnify:CR=1 FL=1|nr:hypothetical protein A9Q99_08140 [Gammaproteobacteria bacterium 45_16_T64]